MSDPQPDMRALVAELEREERAYRAADAAVRTIRMHRGPYGVAVEVGHTETPPEPKGWWMRLWTGNPNEREASDQFNDDEITEIADALWQIALKHRDRAHELARQLNTRSKL